MQNIVLLLTLLILPYWGLLPTGLPEAIRGRVGIALVFAFTAIGHFALTRGMAQMLPPWVPARIPLIYVTGVLELLLAVAVLIPGTSHAAGLALCLFLILILPSNIYAALARVPFGGHEFGPAYLWVRVPLQLLLIGWVYWFAVRTAP